MPSLRPALSVRPKPGRLAACALAAMLLGGCSVISFPEQVRGNRVDPDSIKEIVVGTTTRGDVTSLLGSPTAKATFDPNTWIYISSTTRRAIGSTQAVLDQQVVAITFDDNGVVKSVEQHNQDDSKQVAFVSRTTPSPGTEANFLQMLLGNIGRFGPAGGSGLSGTQTGNY